MVVHRSTEQETLKGSTAGYCIHCFIGYVTGVSSVWTEVERTTLSLLNVNDLENSYQQATHASQPPTKSSSARDTYSSQHWRDGSRGDISAVALDEKGDIVVDGRSHHKRRIIPASK